MNIINNRVIPNHAVQPRQQRNTKYLITENIKKVKREVNDSYHTIKNLVKKYNNIINEKIEKITNTSHKKHYKFNVEIPYIASNKIKKIPVIEKKHPIPLINKRKLEDIKTIDHFVRKIKEENICFLAEDNKKVSHRGILNTFSETGLITLFLNKRNYLGHGTYGTAYRIGNFVIKVPFYDVYKINPHSEVNRCANLLNQLNRDKNFSRAITLNNGKDVLISKYISGDDIIGKEAYDFVKERGRVLFDYNSKGNVKKDHKGQTYIIDTDLAAQPIKLKRHPSLGTLEIRELHKIQPKRYPIQRTENYPLYYSQIKN